MPDAFFNLVKVRSYIPTANGKDKHPHRVQNYP